MQLDSARERADKNKNKIKKKEEEIPLRIEDIVTQMKSTTLELKDKRNTHIDTEDEAYEAHNKLAHLNQAMIQMLKIQAAPKVDLDVFSGDALEYYYFMSNFKDMVESSVDDPRGRLNRLIKYTKGEAKDLIKHYVHNSNETCYDDAIALLQKEYGDPLRIACAFLERLKSWPQVKYGDGASLKALHRFLLQCQTYQKGGLLTGLDSPLEIRNIQLKLPLNLQDKWGHLVGKIRKHKAREATFSDFVEFVDSESTVLNDPVYSRKGPNESKKEDKDRLKNFATGTNQTEEVDKEDMLIKNLATGSHYKNNSCPYANLSMTLTIVRSF